MKKEIFLVLVLASGLVADVTKADFIFGAPSNLGPMVNSTSADSHPSISADGLSFYFASGRPGGYGGELDIWVAKRATTKDEWGEPVNLGPEVNSPFVETPNISPDGLFLYIDSDRPGGYGDYDIWVTTRLNTHSTWGEPINLGPAVNTSALEFGPCISADGLELYFSRGQTWQTDIDIWVSKRADISDQWDNPIRLGPAVNGYDLSFDSSPSISVDELVLFFNSMRAGGVGHQDLWMSRRDTPRDAWGAAVNLGPTVNSEFKEADPAISTDGLTLYFSDTQSPLPGGFGGGDLWKVSVIPVVDFNGDEFVDTEDVRIMEEHWGENYSLCDIAPMPWGDSIVDEQDMAVLEEHLFKEFLPSDLIAYWKLDEKEGEIAHNTVGERHAILNGKPTWQPDSGQISGGLELDGVDDYVETGFELNPEDGAFSVFAWVKGGSPSRVIISQADGTGIGQKWLSLDFPDGNLMTGLIPLPAGRYIPQPLVSESIISDDQWHSVGLVWDGSHRYLYVDGEEVAKDVGPMTSQKFFDGHLHIGVGSTLDAASFWVGLIDDVRVYRKALSADEVKRLPDRDFPAGPAASRPDPSDGDTYPDTSITLSWRPGSSADSHDVYFGEDVDDVIDGNDETFYGSQSSTSLIVGSPGMPYPDGLVPGATYYWRVDEVNDLHPDSPWKGEAWSFTIDQISTTQTKPKYVIFFIGDGMGFEQVKAAGMYTNGEAGTLSFESFPYKGQLTTYASDSLITDSPSATTSMATGVKVSKDMISVAYPGNGSELETLLEYFKARSKSTGLVTTSFMTDATPAAFGAHEFSRNNTTRIAEDYMVQTRPNVLFGGGGNGMRSPTLHASGYGYVVVNDYASMKELDTENINMVSGQFGDGPLPYEPVLGSLPHLSEMTTTALDILDNDPDGFFLMVEGGRIDHACHDNNINNTVLETVEFDNAVQVAIGWATGRTDTLILVTSDHETGGLTVLRNNSVGKLPTVSWSSNYHTSVNVPVYAWGVNADMIYGIMDNTEIFTVVTGNLEAWNPNPGDGTVHPDTSVTLSWRPGSYAASHDVYFGEDYSDVLSGSGGTFQGNQSSTSLPIGSPQTGYPDVLIPGTTYYWRIDEINDLHPESPWRGEVWSFTLPGTVVTDPNIVCLWTFEESGSSVVVDWSGHGNDGTLQGNPQLVAGHDSASALRLDGIDDSVIRSLGTTQTFVNCTVAFWVKTDLISQDEFSGVFSNHHPNTAGFQIDLDGGNPGNYRIHPSGLLFGPVSTEWVHLAVSCVRTGATLYYNGKQTTNGYLVDLDFNQFAVGVNRGGVNRFAGVIDDFYVYNRALTAEEIEALAH